MIRNTHQTGNLSEAKVIAAFTEVGWQVLLPFGDGAPYDLVVDSGLSLLKVQVKTGRLRNGCILFPMQRFSGHGDKPRKYQRGELDVFAVFCPDNQKVYLIPFLGLTEGRLRVIQTQNNQKQGIRLAEEFEFGGFIEGIKRKMVEVSGIEPLTS